MYIIILHDFIFLSTRTNRYNVFIYNISNRTFETRGVIIIRLS